MDALSCDTSHVTLHAMVTIVCMAGMSCSPAGWHSTSAANAATLTEQ